MVLDFLQRRSERKGMMPHSGNQTIFGRAYPCAAVKHLEALVATGHLELALNRARDIHLHQAR